MYVEALAQSYTKTCNIVLQYHPREVAKDPVSLEPEIDTKLYEVDVTEARELFRDYWNAVVRENHPAAIIKGEVKMCEWQWAIGLLIQGCRQAFSASARIQFNAPVAPVGRVKDDLTDQTHAYYCAGAVWRSVLRKFVKSDRVKTALSAMWLTHKLAVSKGLPTTEVDIRYTGVVEHHHTNVEIRLNSK